MAVTVTNRGIKLSLDERVISPNMIKTITEGRYEFAESKNIEKIIAKDEVILELGSGIGFITALAAKNPLTKRIVSYEANPKLLPTITETLTENTDPARKNWEVRNAILQNGTSEIVANFYIHKNFWASSLLPIDNPDSIEQIPIQNFNAVLNDIKPTMIICDIEGGELELFLHADLSSVRKVYMELHQRRIGRRGMVQVFNAMQARNFHYDQMYSHGSVVLFSHVDE